MITKLSSVISPSFYDLHKDIKENKYTHYWLKGGRASTKSSFIAVEIITGIMKDPEANAIVYRRYGNTLFDSVVAQLTWAINVLKVNQFWAQRRSPLELVYKPTGQRIIFRGLDDPEKSKGIKLAEGFFKFLWFEELTEFKGVDEIEQTIRSVIRGEGHCNVFYSYNPPKNRKNWVNTECLISRTNKIVHHSTYLDVPVEWLGDQFIEDAEETKRIDEQKYRWAYLGEITGTGGAIFENLETREISDDEIDEFDRIYNGVDWGYYPDPFAFNKMYYSASSKTLYIYDEYEANKKGNKETADELIKNHGVGYNDLILADSAEPKSIGDYRSYGLNCRPVKKGPGSVNYSMKWLQSLNAIIIDPERCPHTAKEFSEYEYERTRDGEFMEGYPDANNHHIDAVRYGMWPVWKVKGE